MRYPFPATLKGLESSWFYSLPANSIGSFRILHRHFLAWFEGNIRLRKEIGDPFSLRQHELESLKGYVGQFMEILVNIEPLK